MGKSEGEAGVSYRERAGKWGREFALQSKFSAWLSSRIIRFGCGSMRCPHFPARCLLETPVSPDFSHTRIPPAHRP
ncbi:MULTISPECIES: hypothetical protein [Blautia]|uniref:hypothetical protein n=1 Tax=Blautia TaxID=572511 RepID=UPI0011C8E635|nr:MULTISPECIES: hypothetical protein [Blautia]